jgi:hypothetical protein
MAKYRLSLLLMLLMISAILIAACDSFHEDKANRVICEEMQSELQCNAEPSCAWTPQGCKPA